MQHGGIQWDVLLTLWKTLDWSTITRSILTRFKTTLLLCPTLSPDVNQVKTLGDTNQLTVIKYSTAVVS